MGLNADGIWLPDLSEKQEEARAACLPSPKNVILLNGPRKSGKTHVLEHVVPQHAWTTDRGNICMLTITQSAGSDSGPWEQLVDQFLPEWIGDPETGEGGNFGMEWVRQPFIQGTTKKPTCIVSNMYGNRSKISLESLKNEDEVEARFKGKVYSMIWVNELSNFRKRKTFDTLRQCLRCGWLTPDQHLFAADTNPSDEGTSSWIYQLWYIFAFLRDDQLVEQFRQNNPDFEGELDVKKLIGLRDRLKTIEFTIDDNTSLSQEQKDEVFADWNHDAELLDRYYYGKWVTATADALFRDVFRPHIHVVGERSTPANHDPEVLLPLANCTELITGWDPGDSINSAAVIAEKTYRVVDVIKRDNGDEDPVRAPVMKFLDELVITGTPHRLEDFVLDFMQKMLMWESHLGKVGRILWRHWADRSVFERRQQQSLKFLADLIYQTSVLAIRRNEAPISSPIILQAADRSPGSLGPRIDLWKRMLFDDRLYFSAEFCPKLVEMNKGLRRPKHGSKLIQAGSPHKHPFDAASYLLSEECYQELNWDVRQEMRRGRKKESGLVMVPL